MQFRVLGPLEVVDDGRRLDLGPPKQRSVLALLLLNANQVVSLDRLIDELWGEEPPPRAAATLQAYISNLRRALEPGRAPRERPQVLVTQPPGYLLRVDPGNVDAVRFERAAAEGRSLLAGGRPAAARERLEEALALWRGAALGDFAFANFAQAEAGRLEELRLAATEDRLQALDDLGCHAEVVAEAEALVAAHPLRERLWGLLMVALYRSGRQADALRAYGTARRMLAEELGIEPGRALRQLEADILSQAPSLEWRAPTEERPAATTTPFADPPDTGSSADGRRVVVGRREELARLERVLAETEARRGRVVLISGEPGIGKTRLAEEVVDRATGRGWKAAWGGSVEGGGTPAYWPWVGVLRSVLSGEDAEGLREAMGPGSAELAQIVPDLEELTGPLEPPPTLDPETARLRLFEAVAGLLAAAGRRRPVVAVVDDLQWADAPSLQLLGFVGPAIGAAPVVVVGTYRPAEVGPGHPLSDSLAALARHQVVERIPLKGLSESEVAGLMEATTGSAMTPEVVAVVRARTEGNPFFVAELVRLLQSERDLAPDAVARGVPAGVRDVVRRRLARLPEQTMALLSLAAVAGREFELSVIEAAAELDPDRVLELVEAAVVSGLVVEDGDDVGRLRFSHDLVRETITADLTGLRRARLHARLGQALEARYGDDDNHIVELAHHALSAGSVADGQKAISYALRAAEVEIARLAHEQGEAQLRRALDVARRLPAGPDRDRLELEVLLRLSTLLMSTKGYAAPETGEAFSAARRLCERLGETDHVVRVLYGLFAFNLVGARYDECRRLADELLDVANASGHPAHLVAAHQAVGLGALQQGDLASGAVHLEQALAVTDGLNDPWLASWFPIHPMVATRVFLAWAVWERGDPERAWTLMEEALDFAGCHGDNLTTVHALHFVAWIAAFDRQAPRALEATARVTQLSEENHFPLYAAITAVLGGWAQAELGQPEEGIAAIEAGLAAMEATGAWMVHTFYMALLAEAQWRAGRVEDALESVEQAFGFVGRAGEHFYEAELHRLRGELLMAASPHRDTEALADLERALALARAQGARSLEERAARSLEEASRRQRPADGHVPS